MIIFGILIKNRIKLQVFDSDKGSLLTELSSYLNLPPYPNPSDYGVGLGQPSSLLSFLTLADSDGDGKWNALVQIRDFIVNIKLPFKVKKGVNPYSPLIFRNNDNSGVIYR